jgi:hypothetical protein
LKTSLTLQGCNATLFIPHAAFEAQVKPQLARLELPSQQCLDSAHEEVLRVFKLCAGRGVSRYEALKARIVDSLSTYVFKLYEDCRQTIADLMAMELTYINTGHPDFIGGMRARSVLT